MPGKKGFGDARKKSSESPVYKKQKFGTPFKMTGYSYPGTSPVKQDNSSGMSKEGYKIHMGDKFSSFPKPPGLNTSKNNNKGTLRGVTKFESDFPKLSKLTKLHSKSYKKVYDYFTKK